MATLAARDPNPPSPVPPTSLTRNQIRGFWASWGGWTLDGMDSVVYALVLVPALRELLPHSGIAANKGNIGYYGGLLFALFLLGWGLAFLWGPLVDKFGRVLVLMLTIVWYSVFTFLSALVTSVWQLAILRFLAGIGIGGEWAIGGTFVAEEWPESRRRAGAGYMHTGYYVGIFLAAIANYANGARRLLTSGSVTGAGQAAQAGLPELGEEVPRRPAGQPAEPVPLDGGVRLQVQPGVGAVDDPDDVQVPLVGELVVQAADDVQLGGPAAVGLGGLLEDLLVAHDVAPGAAQVGPEGTEGTAVNAHVGRVEVRVDVVIGEATVLPLADEVGQLAQREQVGLLVEEDALVERESLAGLDLFPDHRLLAVRDAVLTISPARSRPRPPAACPRRPWPAPP